MFSLQGGEDGFGGLTVGEVGGVDARGGGFAVEVFAGTVEIFQGAAGIVGLQQGAFAVFDALMQLVGAGVEPNNGTNLAQQGAVFLGHNHPATGGDD